MSRSILQHAGLLALWILSVPAHAAGPTAEELLGRYWEDPLFGSASAQEQIVVDVYDDHLAPGRLTVQNNAIVSIRLVNKSEQAHLFVVTRDRRALEDSEDFQNRMRELRLHAEQTRSSGGTGRHQHSDSGPDEAAALVRTLDQNPAAYIKPGDQREWLLRFDEATEASLVCLLPEHRQKPLQATITLCCEDKYQ